MNKQVALAFRSLFTTTNILLLAAAVSAVALMPVSVPAQDVSVKEYPNGTGVRVLSPAPKPGVHPRIFLSPEDLPAFRETVTKSPARQIYYAQLKKIVADTLDNPKSPEGRVMALIVGGKTPDDSQFAATTQMGRALMLAGIECTVTNDTARGEKLAKVLAAWGNYQLSHWVRKPDPVGLSNSFDADICLAYDFIAQWMNEDQRVPVRSFIAKMSSGIHIFTWNMPAHWRMWNWAGLHVHQGWGSLAIEGEPGYTPQLWDEAKQITRDFGNYNVHPSGALTEDLTYFTLGFEGSGPVMIAMAKRGGQDIWANTNFSKFKYHLLNQLYPWGGGFLSHADGVGSGFYTSFAMWKYMYPNDPIIDYTWRHRVGEDYADGGAGNDAGMRVWVVTLFGTEHFPQPMTAADLKQPITYFCPDRGYLVARTGWDKDALKMDFEAKQDYPIAGHNHADANNFTLDALGRSWVTDVGYHAAAGHLHNEILVDGVGESPWPMPGGRWIDLINAPDVAIGVSDARHAYNYHWSNTGWSAQNDPPSDKEKWEKETDPIVAKFYEGQENRTSTGTFDHWSPFLLRSTWNPVEKAYRTAAFVRGAHPYVFIVDDISKDDQTHLFEWIQQMPDDLEILGNGGEWVVLGAKTLPPDPKDKNAKPQPDNRRLLVQLVGVDSSDRNNAMAIRLESVTRGNAAYEKSGLGKRLTIPARSASPNYKVLLYPFREGQPLPEVVWNAERTQCRIAWADQQDVYTFGTGAGGRTLYRLDRNGKELAKLTAAPIEPVIRSSDRVFADTCTVEFENSGPGQEIRYTLDGSAPTADSTFYAGPFAIFKSATVKAVTCARSWNYGDQRLSAVVQASFTRQSPLPAVSLPQTKPGLQATVYQGFWNDLPDFAKEKPLLVTTVDRFALPPEMPAKGFGVKFTGFIQAPATGVYTFGLKCDDAGKIWIDDQLVVDSDGPHVVNTRTGQVALAAGWHRITVANCDHALPHGKGKGDGSWAFSVLWAPPQAGGLGDLSASMLAQDAATAVDKKPLATIPAQKLAIEPGLDYTAFDRGEQAGTPAFFDIDSARPLFTGGVASIPTPTSSEKLLNVYRGFLKVPHAGGYQFSLPASGISEITLGKTVVYRTSPEGCASQTVQLEEGSLPIVVKIAKGDGLVQWKGPGMDWQSIQAEQYARPARPQVFVDGRPDTQAFCELYRPAKITLNPPAQFAGAKVRFTLDGGQPNATSALSEGAIDINRACDLKAQAFQGDQPVGDVLQVSYTLSNEPMAGALAVWSAAQFNQNAMPNLRKTKTPGLTFPAGTAVVDDPQRGKVLSLEGCPKLNLDDPNILKNELTFTFWVKSAGNALLVRHGYAHFGFFVELNQGGGMRVGGGGSWDAITIGGGVVDAGQWRHVAVTFNGDKPGGGSAVYVDGVLKGTANTPMPCVTKQLEFLERFTGQLSEIRMYNRVLNQDEVAALANASGTAK